MKRQALLLVLDPRRLVRVEQAPADGDQATAEVARVELEVGAAAAQGAVAPDAASGAHDQRFAEHRLGDRGLVGALVDLARGLAHQRAVRGHEVGPIEPGEEADLDVVERPERAEVVEALRTHCAPEALHLAARLRVVRLGVHEPDAEPAARDPQRLADVGRAIVEVERVRRALASERADEEREHLGLALGRARAEPDDVAAVVVEDRVDAQRDARAVLAECRAVADVGVPEDVGRSGLPAAARLVVRGDGGPVEPALGVEAPERRLGERAGVDAPVGDEGAEDQRGADARVRLTNRDEKRLLGLRQRAAVTAVAARLGSKCLEPAGAVAVVPALEGRDAVAARPRGARRTHRLRGELAQRLGQLAVVERASAQHGAEDLRAEQRHLLGGVFGSELVFHLIAPFGWARQGSAMPAASSTTLRGGPRRCAGSRAMDITRGAPRRRRAR